MQHRAPAVGVCVARSRWHLRLVLLLSLAGGVALIAWVEALAWFDLLVCVLALACCAAAVLAWYRSPQGNLHWDGQHWRWAAAGQIRPCNVQVHLDAQRFVLLSLEGAGQPRVWLWLDALPDLAQWLALRRALVCSQGTTTSDDHTA